MFSKIVTGHDAKLCRLVLRPAIRNPSKLKCVKSNIYATIRVFSNETLKKTIDDINKKYIDNPNATSTSEEQKINDEPNSEKVSASSSNIPHVTSKSIIDTLRTSFEFISEQTKLAWGEITGKGKESVLTRTVEQAATYRAPQKKEVDEDGNEIEQEPEPTGPNAIVVVKEAKNAWEQMKDRLQDSPLIKEILKGSRNARKAALNTDLGKGAENVAKSVQDKLHDAREFWETSQNPAVYYISGFLENVTGETDEALATKAILNLDKNFVKEVWSEEVRTTLAPKILKAHLVGDTAALKPWLGEAVYSKLAADIRARKHDGIVFDHNILEIDETQLVMKLMESNSSPVIVVVYMVQQINCIRNRKGEIIEGSESDIRAKFYSMAFQQSYEEDTKEVRWKVVDYEFAGDQPYY